MRHAAVVAVLLVMGCTDEVTITQGTCGNDVLEPGEDCDAPGSACTPTCRLACSATQACPDGMACGHDGACHAPTGLVHEATVEAFATGTTGLGDIDGDGIVDAIGVDSGTVSSALGAASMPLASVLQQSAPAASGFATIRDYTGDGHPDVLLPTTGGLFAFASTSGALAPVAFPHDESPAGTAIHMRGAASVGAGTLVLLDAIGDASGSITDTLLSIDGVAGARPCGMVFGPAAIKGRTLHPYKDGNRQLVPMVLSEAVDTGNSNRTFTGLCIDGPGVGADSKHVSSSLLGAGTGTATVGETFFASLDGAVCPDLVIALTSPQNEPEAIVVPGQATANGCTMAPLTGGVTQIVGAGTPLAMIHLDLGGVKTPALVTTLGIITVNVSAKTWAAVTPATRPWEYAVVADVNGDGREDLITVGTSNDVEVLTQLGSPTSQPQFHQTVIPTPDAIQLVATGDFDGDHQLDVAMVALDTLGSHDGHVEVSFAEPPTAYTAPTTLATISELYFLVARDVLDPTLPAGFDHTDDVLIGAGGDDLMTESASLTYFYGAGSREMFAPKTGPSITGYKGLFAFGGRFGDGGAYGVVAGFAPDVIGQAASGALVTLTRTDEANLSNPGAPIVTGGCGQIGLGTGAFCIDQAKFGVWARSTATPGDVLVGFRDDLVLPGDSTCGASFVPGQTSLTIDPCASMFPQAPAYTQLMGTSGSTTTSYYGESFDAVRVLAPSDDQATLVLGGTYTLATGKTGGATTHPSLSVFETALVGHMTLGSSGPIVDQLVELGGACPAGVTNCTPSEVSAYTGTAMYCNDAALIELGSRVVDGKTYGGAGKELVTACAVRAARGVTQDAAVFARFAAPDGGPPHYETLVASTGVPHMSVRVGDVNGDGLEDVVGTAGSTGNGELFVFLQCDTHDTSCTKEGK